jgi:hypothetical protein
MADDDELDALLDELTVSIETSPSKKIPLQTELRRIESSPEYMTRGHSKRSGESVADLLSQLPTMDLNSSKKVLLFPIVNNIVKIDDFPAFCGLSVANSKWRGSST